MVNSKITIQDKLENRIKKTLAYSQRFLNSIKRKSTENYMQHGIGLFETLKEIPNSASLHSVCLLHDILSHPNGKQLLKNSPLTKSEQTLIQKLHALRNLNIDSNIKDLDKAIGYFSADYRILILRMAHRLSDIRQLENFNKKRAKKIAMETLHMYTHLAGRLGLHKWRYEMEDICFKHLFPRMAKKLEKKFDLYKKNDLFCLEHTGKYINRKLLEANIKCDLEYRIKTIYSAYRKMIFKNRKFEELTDRLAIRIITPAKDECYQALGVIHSIMHPIPGKLKDYIGAPKENGYQSIHTVVFPLPNVTNMPIEIQIRSRDMHQECEFGIASHFDYKKYNYSMRYNSKIRVDLIRNLEIMKYESLSAKKFSNLLQSYFRGDQVLIFDSLNRIYHLTKPSSALDFICIYYKEKAAYLKSIKINGIISRIDTIINDGDVIEAKFQKKKSYSKKWMRMCHRKRSQSLLLEFSGQC